MQVVSIAAKTQTSVDDLVDDVIVVLRGNTVLSQASANKQTEAFYMSGAHMYVCVCFMCCLILAGVGFADVQFV